MDVLEKISLMFRELVEVSEGVANVEPTKNDCWKLTGSRELLSSLAILSPEERILTFQTCLPLPNREKRAPILEAMLQRNTLGNGLRFSVSGAGSDVAMMEMDCATENLDLSKLDDACQFFLAQAGVWKLLINQTEQTRDHPDSVQPPGDSEIVMRI